MEPERKKPGGCPPKTEQKPYFVHTAALTGIAVFFCSTDFFLFSGPYPSSGKSQQPSARAFWCVRFFFVGKCGFLAFPGRTSLPCCRGPPSVWISSRNSDETEVHSVDAGKKRIWVRGQFIEVTDEVYAAYMQGDRKMRYFENDLNHNAMYKYGNCKW